MFVCIMVSVIFIMFSTFYEVLVQEIFFRITHKINKIVFTYAICGLMSSISCHYSQALCVIEKTHPCSNIRLFFVFVKWSDDY